MLEDKSICGAKPSIWMVKKEFFCKNHKAEADLAARKETAQHHRFHKNQEADRAEQRRRPQ